MTEGEQTILTELQSLRGDVGHLRESVSELRSESGQLSAQHVGIARRLEHMEISISGDGNGNPGLRMRIDRVEQKVKSVAGIAKGAFVGVLGAAAEFLRSQIK